MTPVEIFFHKYRSKKQERGRLKPHVNNSLAWSWTNMQQPTMVETRSTIWHWKCSLLTFDFYSKFIRPKNGSYVPYFRTNSNFYYHRYSSKIEKVTMKVTRKWKRKTASCCLQDRYIPSRACHHLPIDFFLLLAPFVLYCKILQRCDSLLSFFLSFWLYHAFNLWGWKPTTFPQIPNTLNPYVNPGCMILGLNDTCQYCLLSIFHFLQEAVHEPVVS